jgi:uncharacterized spore protein YtfJ
MDEQKEHPAKRTARKTADVVPTGDPEHEVTPAAATPGALAFLDRARDTLTVRRVYGDPIERDGITVIPAAKVRGGGGGGADNLGNGGGGFGVSATPAGAYVIKDGNVTWKPAIDATRIALMGQLVAIVFLLTVRSVVKALAKRR